MSTTTHGPVVVSPPLADEGMRARVSARFGLAFTACQLAVMVGMAVFVLPHGGSPNDPALERGQRVLDAENLYRFGNYAFVLAGMLLLGFLGVVHLRLRRADGTGVLATVALEAGTRSRRTPSPSRRCPGCSSSVRSCSACASPAVHPGSSGSASCCCRSASWGV